MMSREITKRGLLAMGACVAMLGMVVWPQSALADPSPCIWCNETGMNCSSCGMWSIDCDVCTAGCGYYLVQCGDPCGGFIGCRLFNGTCSIKRAGCCEYFGTPDSRCIDGGPDLTADLPTDEAELEAFIQKLEQKMNEKVEECKDEDLSVEEANEALQSSANDLTATSVAACVESTEVNVAKPIAESPSVENASQATPAAAPKSSADGNEVVAPTPNASE